MTGWRLGWIVAPRALMPDLGKLIEYNTSCSPMFVQRAGVVAINDGEPTIAHTLRALSRARAISWSRELNAIAGRRAPPPPTGRDVRRSSASTASPTASSSASGWCARPSSGLAPGSAFGPEGEGFVRWCFAASDRAARRRRRAAAPRTRQRADARCRRSIRRVIAPRPRSCGAGASCAGRHARGRLRDAGVPASAADMTKTLHVALQVAETGFDPQAISDSYSFDICRAIFDPLYTYDYFARPVRMVPEHRRRHAADHRRRPHLHDQGQARHLLRRRPGVQGQAARADRRGLRLQHQAHLRSRRCARTGCTCSSTVWSGSTRCLPARARPAASTTTPRSRACRRSTATRCASASRSPTTRSSGGSPTPRCPRSRAKSSTRYEDASNRVMEHPVGTGPYRLKEWTRGQKIVLEANPDFRDETLSGAGRRQRTRRRGDRQGTTPARSCRSSAASRSASSRRPAAAARVRQRPARLSRAAARRWPTTCSTAPAEARLRQARHRAAPADRAVDSVSSFSTWTIRSSAATRRRRSRCGAR